MVTAITSSGPSNEAAIAASIKCARTDGNLALAEQIAGAALVQYPRSKAILSQAAYNAQRLPDWDRACARLHALQQMYADVVPARVCARIIRAFRKSRQPERALASAQRALLLHPENVLVNHEAALNFEAARHWSAAVDCLQIVLSHEREQPIERNFFRLIKALHLSGNTDRAMAWIASARALFPQSRRFHVFAAPAAGADAGAPSAQHQFDEVTRLNHAFRFQQALERIAEMKKSGLDVLAKRQLLRLEKVIIVNSSQYETAVIVKAHNGSKAFSGVLAGIWKVKKNIKGDLKFFGALQADAQADDQAEDQQVYIFVNNLFFKSVFAKVVRGHRIFTFSVKKRTAARLPSNPEIHIATATGLLMCENRAVLDQHALRKSGLLAKLRKGYIVTKKGTLRRPMPNDMVMREKISAYLSRLGEYFQERFGYRLWLSYGTLLGYVREGNFIFHDDDVDVSYLSKQDNPADVINEMMAICRQMIADGWNVRVSVNGIIKPDSGFNMDIYASWIQGGNLYMQNTTCFPFGVDDVHPLRNIEFNGAEAWIPNNPEGFLASKYGATWRVPDPGYQRQMAPGAREVLTLAKPNRAQLDEMVGLRSVKFGLGS